MLKLRISFILLCALLFSATTCAAVQIVSSSPKKFIQGDYSISSLPLEVYYANPLPNDITGFNVNDRVKIYARAEGNFQLLTSSGWTPDSQNTWIPTQLLKNQGYLQVKVTVDGVDSNVFSISIVPPPNKPPVIMSVSPDHFDLTNGTDSESLIVMVNNIDGYSFSGVLIDGNPAFVGNVILQPGEDAGGTIMTWMPKELLTKSAQHTVQVQTRAGQSNIVKVMVGTLNIFKSSNIELKPVSKPLTITILSPSFLTKAQTSAGAPPVSVTAIFSGSTPETILYRVDKAGAWYQIQQPIIFGNQATFSLPCGTLQPKSVVEIKMVNATGEAVKSLPILLGAQDIQKTPVSVKPLPLKN
jgi:hypothetical protein